MCALCREDPVDSVLESVADWYMLELLQVPVTVHIAVYMCGTGVIPVSMVSVRTRSMDVCTEIEPLGTVLCVSTVMSMLNVCEGP
jgi:hypothetical protein